jgi:hypothetical protein
MKNLIILFLCLLLFPPVVMVAQDPDPPAVGVVVDETPSPDISGYFASLAYLVPAVLLITQIVLKYIKTKYDQVVSWIVSLLMCSVGWLLQLGIFCGTQWWWIFIYGLAAGLVANGVFDIPIVTALLNFIRKKK